MIWRYLPLLALAFLLASGCSMNPNLQGRGADYLQGEWQQDSIPGKEKLITYSSSNFKFDCDSFYLAISSVSKVNNGADSCMNEGRWTEYVRGTYQQQGDTVLLHGFFYDAKGKLKEANTCFRHGPYNELFNVTNKSDSALTFSSTSVVLPIKLRLIKRTSCTPKPLNR